MKTRRMKGGGFALFGVALFAFFLTTMPAVTSSTLGGNQQAITAPSMNGTTGQMQQAFAEPAKTRRASTAWVYNDGPVADDLADAARTIEAFYDPTAGVWQTDNPAIGDGHKKV